MLQGASPQVNGTFGSASDTKTALTSATEDNSDHMAKNTRKARQLAGGRSRLGPDGRGVGGSLPLIAETAKEAEGFTSDGTLSGEEGSPDSPGAQLTPTTADGGRGSLFARGPRRGCKREARTQARWHSCGLSGG